MSQTVNVYQRVLVAVLNSNLLVGGLEHFLFFHLLVFGIIIPTDQYFSEGFKPPTSLKMGIFEGDFFPVRKAFLCTGKQQKRWVGSWKQ